MDQRTSGQIGDRWREAGWWWWWWNRTRLGRPAQGALPGFLMEVGLRGGPVVPYRHCWLPPRFVRRWAPGAGRSCRTVTAGFLLGVFEGGPQGRICRSDPSLLASSWRGAILWPVSLPDYTVCGPPRSNLTDPRYRDALHFDFTAGGSVRGRCGSSGFRSLRLVVLGRVGCPGGRFLVLGAVLAVVRLCFCWFGFSWPGGCLSPYLPRAVVAE